MNFLAVIIIPLCIIFTYWNLPNTFFQQDEWQTLSFTTYYRSKGTPGIIESFLPIDAISHFNPLATVFAWYEYMFYYTRFPFYAWQSIILHIVNSLLLYYLAYSWFKKRSIAVIAALFFAVNSIPHQAVTWVAAANSYEVPTAFILISLIFFHKFLLQTRNERKHLRISLLTLFTSLLFHENGIFLFLFYPTIFLIFASKKKKKLSKYFFSLSLVLTLFLFVLIRIPFFFGFLASTPSITDTSRPPIGVYPYRLLSTGLKSFAGSVIPEKTLITVSDGLVRLAYPQFMTPDRTPNPYVAQSIVFDLVSYTISFLIVCFILFFIRFTREKEIRDGILWSFVFAPMALLPYGFVLGSAGYASILDPKFYYVASIGLSILIGLVVVTLAQKFKAIKFIIVALYILYVLFHVYSTKTYLDALQTISFQRKAFFATIKSSHTTLPQNVVFFTHSDTAYYGMPDSEKILPVQVGFGKMLMLWYQREEKFPGCLYEGQFLSGMLDEGYRFCDGRGFGYFRDYSKLVETVKQNKLAPESIIAYSWDGKAQRFASITDQIRRRLQDVLELR